MIYFISYDVANPKRLVKVSKTLENYGIRIQYSFFECELQKQTLEELKGALLAIIDKSEDSLLIYPLCEDCVKKTQGLGTGDIFVPQSYQIL